MSDAAHAADTAHAPAIDTPNPTDLVISRRLRAPRALLWRAWTEPALLAQWWCPKPWTTDVRAFELRPGGAFHTFLQGPDEQGGQGSSDNPGCFLEVVPHTRLVFTTQLIGGYRPASSWMPMTAAFTLADEGGGTRYGVTVMHLDPATRDRHEQMGFFDGWHLCIDQLDELALTLR